MLHSLDELWRLNYLCGKAVESIVSGDYEEAIKYLETQLSYDSADVEEDEWSLVPGRAHFVVRDPDGKRYWFEHCPRIVCGAWDNVDGMWGVVSEGAIFPSVGESIENWEQAIVERPENI